MMTSFQSVPIATTEKSNNKAYSEGYIMEGEKRSMPHEQAIMVIGEALKNNAPYTCKEVNELGLDDAADWGDFAFSMVEKNHWNREILSSIVSYSMANIPMIIDIFENGTMSVIGGVDRDSEKGRKTLEDLAKKFAEGKVKFTNAKTGKSQYGKKYFNKKK